MIDKSKPLIRISWFSDKGTLSWVAVRATRLQAGPDWMKNLEDGLMGHSWADQIRQRAAKKQAIPVEAVLV